MLSIILLLVLVWSFYIGYIRGLVVQGFYVVSAIVAMVVAAQNFKPLAAIYAQWVPFQTATQGASTYFFESKYLFDLDQIFYAGLAFLTFYVAVYALMRLVGIFVHLASGLLPDGLPWSIASGVLSVLVTLVSLQMVLTILATIPAAPVQNFLHDSPLASWMIKHTPFTSQFYKDLWMSTIRG